MITLEQVEKLKERANVSYEDAKSALEITDGDLLEAVIYLEKQGKMRGPQMSSYNTQTGGVHGEQSFQGDEGPWDGRKWRGSRDPRWQGQNDYEYARQRKHHFREKCGIVWRKFCALVRKANANQFMVNQGNRVVISMPVTVLALAVLFFFWVTIPLLIIGLFCDCRYRFKGPDLGREDINHVMDQAASTVENIKRSVLSEEDGANGSGNENGSFGTNGGDDEDA